MYFPGVALGLVSLLAVLFDVARPRDDHLVLAVFPPWLETREVVLRAASAGELVDGSRLSSAVLVTGDADLATRVLKAGGLPLDPRFPGLCAFPETRDVR